MSHSIKIEDFKLTLLIQRGGSENVKPITRNFLMSYSMSMMLSSKFHSHSIKIEDLKVNPIKPGGEWKFPTY